MGSNNEFQEILSTYNPMDIAMIKSALDAAEVNYFIKGEHVGFLFPILEPSRLMVDSTQIEKAVDALKEIGLFEEQ